MDKGKGKEIVPAEIAASISMPENIVQAAKIMLSLCEKQAGMNSRLVVFATGILEGVIQLEAKQVRLEASQKKLQSIDDEMEAERKKPETDTSLSRMLQSMVSGNWEFHKQLERIRSMLAKMILETDDIKEKLEALKLVADFPQIKALDKYVALHQDHFRKEKKKLDCLKSSLNSSSGMTSPGEEFGLEPFKDIMLHTDGQLLVWNKDDEEWEFADELHPCRKMPGSAWGKFFHDITPGKFFSKEKRPFIEWTHANSALQMLENLDETYHQEMINYANMGIEVRNDVPKNTKMAAATGLKYPVDDMANLDRAINDWDVHDIVGEPFTNKDRPITHISQVRAFVEEAASGVVSEVEEVQEMEQMTYVMPQED